MLIKLTYAAVAATDLVNAVMALYVTVRPGIVEVPNLNADLLDYYYFAGIQQASGGFPVHDNVDIRTKRRLRGDRDVLLRVTNNEVTSMQVGCEVRFLMQLS